MRNSARKSLVVYGVSLAALAAALLLRWLLNPVLEDSLPVAALFGPIALAVVVGGYRPALLVVGLGYLASAYLFMQPQGALGLSDPRSVVSLLLYLFSAAIIVGFGEAVRSARQRHQRGEEQQRALAELMRTTLASIGDGVIATNAGGLITSMNPVAEALTGWTSAEAATLPLTQVFHIVNETTRLAVENPALRALTEGVIVGLANHTILIARDGTERPIDDSAAPIRSASGEVVGCILVFRDISERYRAEAEQRALQEQSATTLESVADGFIRYDRDWRIVYVNSEAERINHFAREEVLGRTVWELFPAVVGTTLETEFRRAVSEQVTIEFENLYEPWGRWYALRCYPAPDGGLTTFIRDITEQKQQREALEASERRFRELAEAMPQIVYQTDADGVIEFANRQWIAYTGQAGAQTTDLQPVVHPDDLGDMVQRWDLAKATGTPLQAEFRLRRAADGEYRWFLTRSVPVMDAAGNVIKWYGTSTDIHDQKRTEQQLAESEARYRAIGESIDFGVWVCDATGRNTYASQSFLRLTGLTQQQCSDFGWGDVLHPDDAAATIAAWKDCVRTEGTWDREQRVRGVDGTWYHILARGVPLRDAAGTVLGWAGINLDVTRLVQTEREVVRLAGESERQRRLYETILTNTPDFMYVFGLDHTVLYANDALITMWGRGLDGVIGKTFLDIGYEPWHAAMHEREIDQVRATRQPIRGEVPFNGTHGRRQYDYIFVPVIGAGGDVEAVAGTTRDVTERKESEAALRTLAAELSEAARRKDEFLATLAHELRNPLAPIRNGLEVMRLAGSSGTIEQARAMMDRQLTQLVRLVDDLLDASRVTSGKLELRKEHVALTAIIEAAMETARPVIEQAEHDLAVVLPDEQVIVDADPTRLAQVVSNLLNNAAKYTPHGGHIRLTARREGEMAVLSVADDGIGIPPDMLTQVFDMFTQVDRTLEKATGGLGIGLSLVKGLVEMHGGTIEARSDGESRGSDFVLRLPAVLAHAPQDEPITDRAATGHVSRRILIADDNVDSADSLARLLDLLGNEVRTAHDGSDALELAESFRPEIVLLDIGMPKLNGYETCRRIRQQPWGSDALLIALTGWGHDDDHRESREAGFDLHLVKPVDIETLSKALASPMQR